MVRRLSDKSVWKVRLILTWTFVVGRYGVEAARATILQEVSSVFGAYGIAVEQRHLSLIADFITFHGAYR